MRVPYNFHRLTKFLQSDYEKAIKSACVMAVTPLELL